MQFTVLTRRKIDQFDEAAFAARQDAEAEAVRTLYADGVIRQIWMRGDMPGAVLMIEAADEAEVRTHLHTLPMHQAGMLEVIAIVPLKPYRAFCPKR